jgi:hypothetical protein
MKKQSNISTTINRNFQSAKKNQSRNVFGNVNKSKQLFSSLQVSGILNQTQLCKPARFMDHQNVET